LAIDAASTDWRTAMNTCDGAEPVDDIARPISSSCACSCGTRSVKFFALPASASTALSDARIWSAFLPIGTQVAVAAPIGPDTVIWLPKRSLSSFTSDSICALVARKAVNAAASPSTASRPWLASFCEFTCRFEAAVLAPPKRAVLYSA
jgi:hypothetical protein